MKRPGTDVATKHDLEHLAEINRLEHDRLRLELRNQIQDVALVMERELRSFALKVGAIAAVAGVAVTVARLA